MVKSGLGNVKMNEAFKLFLSFLSGSFVGSLLQNYFQSKKDRLERTRKFLEQQLRLYGPLYSLVVQNEDAFRRIEEIRDVAKKEFSGRVSAEPRFKAQETRTDEIEQTIDVQNAHIKQTVLVNNGEIFKILADNLHLVDPDDIELVTQFFRDYNYYKVEVPEDKGTKLPPLIAINIGQISFMRPELIDRVKQKFASKQRELRKILKVQRQSFLLKLIKKYFRNSKKNSS